MWKWFNKLFRKKPTKPCKYRKADFTKRRLTAQGEWEYYNTHVHAWLLWEDFCHDTDLNNSYQLKESTFILRNDPSEEVATSNRDCAPYSDDDYSSEKQRIAKEAFDADCAATISASSSYYGGSSSSSSNSYSSSSSSDFGSSLSDSSSSSFSSSSSSGCD